MSNPCQHQELITIREVSRERNLQKETVDIRLHTTKSRSAKTERGKTFKNLMIWKTSHVFFHGKGLKEMQRAPSEILVEKAFRLDGERVRPTQTSRRKSTVTREVMDSDALIMFDCMILY